ncbi:MAG: ATP-binding protein [Ardenticatenia bacterium]|nr:MAG: ATP-binding protein [Ardenticatenia bacterium]
MKEIALHVLDIVENSVAAGATRVDVTVCEDSSNDTLTIVVQDNGKGMDQELLERVSDPFVTTRTTRKVGLGIPLLKAAAEACNGYLRIESTPGKGTRLETRFQRSHIDRMPLGDLAGTFLTLLIAFPQVHWVFRHVVDGREFCFDSEPILKELDGVPLTEPAVLSFVRQLLHEGIARVQQNVG